MKLHAFSQQIVDETFALYEPQDGLIPSRLRGKTIIHLYPKGDTAESDGTLNGYYQNRFFELVVFNIDGKKMRMWKSERKNHDAIFTDKVNITNLSVFKDGGFCVTIEGAVDFLDGQAVTISGRLSPNS